MGIFRRTWQRTGEAQQIAVGKPRHFAGRSLFFSAMISAMAQVKSSGIFGEGTEEITFFISISDDEDAENLEDSSAMTLNSPELAAAF